MKASLYSLIILVLFAASCNSDNNGDKTENKTAAAPATAAPMMPTNVDTSIAEIKKFYDANCVCTTGRDNGKAYVQIVVSNSNKLDSSRNYSALSAGNIAMKLYKNIQAEKANYDEVRCVIMYSDSQKAEKAFTMEQLDTVYAKTQLFDDILECFRSKNYDKLSTYLNDKNGMIPYDKASLIGKVKEADGKFGDLKDFYLYGFIYYKAANGKNILHFSGTMVRTKVNNQFSVDMDPTDPNNQAIVVNYSL
jgi:hypothetical protein